MFESKKMLERPSGVSMSRSFAAAMAPAGLSRVGTPVIRSDIKLTPVSGRPSGVSMSRSFAAAMAPAGLSRVGTPTIRSNIVRTPAPSNIPLPTRIPAGMGAASPIPTRAAVAMGGAARNLPTGRSVVSPVVGDRTGTVPPSTLSTQGAFGGESGGMGAATGAAPAALGPESLSGVESSIGKIGTDVMNTVTSLVPLAIKVVLAIIVIKIVIWLLRGRR